MWFQDKAVDIVGLHFTYSYFNYMTDKAATLAAKVLLQNGLPMPNHIAFCMDGNRRFAKKLSLEEGAGHIAGSESMMRALLACHRLGIKTVSVYAFSIENFNRSKEESQGLFDLVRTELWTAVQDRDSALRKLNWKIRFPGHRDMLQRDLVKMMDEIEAITADCKGIVVNICAPYTTRDDLTTALSKVALESAESTAVKSTETPQSSEQSSEHAVSNTSALPVLPAITLQSLEDARHLAPCEPLDIFVRTSGETRLSDFMLWEIDSSCMVEFTPELWPELTVWGVYRIVTKWQIRTRARHLALKSLTSLPPPPPQVSVSQRKKAAKIAPAAKT